MKTKTASIPLQTALLYVGIAGCWIFYSDRFLALIAMDVATLNLLQTYKGFLFVSLTGIILFFSLRSKLRLVEQEAVQRTEVEKKLYENEIQYSLIFENSGEAILFTEPNGNILTANPAACRMFGRSREDICAIGRAGIIDSKDQRLTSALEERNRTGILKGELTFLRGDGTAFPCEVSSNVFKDAQGNERTSMIIRDISERKAYDSSLRKNIMRLGRAESIARFGSWEVSLLDNIMHASDGAIQIYGFSKNDIPLSEVQAVAMPEYRQYLDSAIKELIEHNKPLDVEYKIRRVNDGTIIDLRSKGEYDADDKTIFGVIHDITEWKRVEKALSFSTSNLQSVINREESIWSLDTNYLLIICNEYFANSYRAAFNIELNAGINLIEILPPDLKAFWKPKYDSALSGQRTSFEYHETITGDVQYFEVILNPIITDGHISGVSALSVNITERKRSEDALRKNEEHKQIILDTLSEGVALNEVVFNDAGEMIDYTILEVNNAFYSIADYTKEYPIIGGRASVVYAMDGKTIHDFWIHHLPATQTVTTDFTSPVSGKIFRISTSPFKNNRFVTSFRDITDQKRAEQQLRESEEKYRGLVENSPDAIALYVDGKIVFVNHECLRLMGASHKNELIGKPVIQFVHPDNRALVGQRMKEIAVDGKPLPTEQEKFIRLDGTSVEVEVKAIPTTYEHNPAVQIIVHDISERKQAEQTLRNSEEKYRLLFENAKDGILQFTPTGQIVAVNDSFAKMHGYTVDELMKKNFIDLDTPETKRLAASRMQKFLSGESMMLEIEHYHKNGHTIPLEVSANRIEIGGEQYILGFHRDITERKRAEEALKNSEDNYRLLFNANNDGISIFYINQDETISPIIAANNSAAQMLGYELAEIIGKHPSELEIYETEEILRQRMDQIKTYGTAKFETELMHKNGRHIPVEINVQVIEYNKRPALMNIVRDITERNQAEAALKESEQFLRETQIIAEIGTYTMDIITGRWISSEILDAIFGIDAEYEKSIAGWSSIVHPEWQQSMIDYFMNDVVGKGIRFNKEYKIIRKSDNKERWVHGIGELKLNGTGQPILMVGTIKDITERKNAEEALRLSEQTYRGIIDSINEAIYIEDPNGQFLDVNLAAQKMYGYTKEEFIGRTPEFLSAPGKNDLTQLMPMLEKALNGEPQVFEFWGLRKDGTIFPKDVSNSLGYYFGKKVNIAVARDITERKQSEEALRQAQKMESIGTLAGGIAHDFNNLLNAVLGQSALAINKLPKESPAVDNINKAIKASERAADLTRQLLAYSGKGKFYTVEIDLNNLVKENVRMLEVSVPKSTQLRYELGSPSPRLIGDIGQIQQVVMNLIINAGEAMGPNPGYITVRTHRIELAENNIEYSTYTNTPLPAGSYAMLQVIDTGSGISRETMSCMFDPFFTTKFTGRGLGLAAVLGIIKGHKGGLRIESEEGKGTTFEIVWPLVESSRISKATEEKKIVVDGEGKTILVIDDEPSVVELLGDVLSEINFKMISALDPLTGIEFYRQHHQDISMVILDYSMPHMDGRTAFEELFQIDKNVKVLLCSGYTEEETMSAFGSDRPKGFFHKPYDMALFAQKVAEIVS